MPLISTRSTAPACQLRVGVIEDHDLVVEGLRAAIRTRRGLVLVAVANCVEGFLQQGTTCDVVVTDLGTPGPVTGRHAIQLLTELGHRVVVLSARQDQGEIRASLAAGAWAHISTRQGSTELLDAVCEVGVGRRPICLHHGQVSACEGELLTARQREVLGCIERGMRNREIADALCISISTVKRHIEELMRRTLRTSRTDLAIWALGGPLAEFSPAGSIQALETLRGAGHSYTMK